MAIRYTTTLLEKITTSTILKILQQAHQQGDNKSSYFYLLVATGGREGRSSQLILGQPRDHTTGSDPESDEDNINDERAGHHVDTTNISTLYLLKMLVQRNVEKMQ